MPFTSDLQLVQAIARGEGQAWNTFIQRYGDLVMSAVVSWCETNNRVPESQYTSVLRLIRGNLPEPAEERDMDREGLFVYRYALDELRKRLPRYQGKSSLATFLRLELRDIRHLYMDRELGRLSVPPAIADLPSFTRDVYRLATRVRSREAIARRLGVDPMEVAKAEKALRLRLQADGREWWELERWDLAAEEAEGISSGEPCGRAEDVAALAERKLTPESEAEVKQHLASCVCCRQRLAFLEEATQAGGIAPPITVPAWVNRDVLDKDGSDSPASVAAGRGWMQKALSMPGWLVGLALGGTVSALALLVLIPRLEYAEVVREPGDQIVAQVNEPLSPELGAKLATARVQLGKSKVGDALANLKSVVAARPDNQEARWLLATTYERLGDRTSANQHYKLFLETERQIRAIEDQRVQQAESKVGKLSDQP